MNTCKLIFRNVCKNIRDYLIYFLTLTLSVSLFYAFNSISDQPAFSNMGMTGTLLYRQLGIMLSTLSTMIAVVLAFLILYANQFLLKRRKKELGVCRPQANRSYAFCADSRVLCHSASRCWRVFCFPDWKSNGCGGRIYEHPYLNQYRTDNRSFSACLRELFSCNVSFL